jgi:hypothetical protein
MAEYALPPGAVKRRAVFGLLDADGWGWATIKATFWFLLIIFLLGYVPDRGYYFTVAPTVDLGYNAISPINLCPADNKTLPCPAPAGAVIPYEQSPEQLALPGGGRAGAGSTTLGENIYIVGGRTPQGTTASVLTTTTFDGNLATWTEGPALPEPRSDAAVVSLGGLPFVVGGKDAAGAPTDTVFQGIVTNGALTGWQPAAVTLPEALSDLSGATTTAGIYVFGGHTADGALSSKTYQSVLSTASGAATLKPFTELTELPLPEARASAGAIAAGGAVFIVGGEGPSGATNSVFFLQFDTHGQPAIDTDTGRVFGWGVSVEQSAAAALPEPRYDFATFTNSGAIHVVGGYDASGAAVTTDLWANPSPIDGTITGWHQLDATELPAPRAEATAVVVGQFVYIVGGSSGGDTLDATILRADVAPRLPFFRLGLFGVTIPALSIQGEIGQQLGYIVAGSAALGNFVILVIIGWCFSHKRETFRFFEWISRGRFRAPPEDEYLT